MSIVATLLTAISLLFSTPGNELERPVGLNPQSVAWATSCCDLSLLIHSPSNCPSPHHLFIGGHEETALGEQESNEIDSSATVSHTSFGDNAFPTLLSLPSLPPTFHARTMPVFFSLRC